MRYLTKEQHQRMINQGELKARHSYVIETSRKQFVIINLRTDCIYTTNDLERTLSRIISDEDQANEILIIDKSEL